MLYGFFLFIHIVVSLMLIGIVLLQSSKGGGLAGIAGGVASSAVLGGRQTATLLHKVTVVLAVVFAVNCLLLGGLSKTSMEKHSVTQEVLQAEESPLDFLGGEAAATSADETAGDVVGEEAPTE